MRSLTLWRFGVTRRFSSGTGRTLTPPSQLVSVARFQANRPSAQSNPTLPLVRGFHASHRTRVDQSAAASEDPSAKNDGTELVDTAVASSPCDIEAVPSLLDEISALGKDVGNGDREGRLELLEKARSLVRALETPRETMLKHCGAQVSTIPRS